MDGPMAKSRFSMEEWRPIHQKPDYEVSSWGRVRHGDRILKGSNNGRGYLTISIYRKTYSIHRLVAEAFIPNPEGFKEVDHIDRDKLNNCVDNLRWVTRSENNLNTHHHHSSLCGIQYRRNNFEVRVTIGYKQRKYIGFFKTLEEAIEARNNFLKE